MFPNKRKLSERGFVKSSNMLIGKKIGVGEIYLAKNPSPFSLNLRRNSLKMSTVIMLQL